MANLVTLASRRLHLLVDQPKSEKRSRTTLTWHGLLIAGNHARSIAHRTWEMVWVNATLDFEF